MEHRMKCDKCGKDTCVITITKNYSRLCDSCYEKYLHQSKPHPIDGEKCKEVIDKLMKKHTF